MNKMINWEATLPLLDSLSVLRVYVTIVSNTDEDLWYSNLESRSKMEWRWQMAPSTVKYAIGKLVKKGLLNFESRGIYRIDRKYLIEMPKMTKD